jgi:hypothetical protein
MITILVDHNIEGQAALLWSTFATEGWLALTGFQLVTFVDVGLSFESSDRTVWQFAQAQQMLLTGNRNMAGDDSLEQTIREDNHATALPVITIGNMDRLVEYPYRERCATRLAEIGLYVEDYLGVGRLFIP